MDEVAKAYTGWRKWSPTSEEWAEFYIDKLPPFEMKENEYLIVESEDGSTTFYCNEHGTLRKFTGCAIKTVKDTAPMPLEEHKKEEGGKQPAKKYSKGKSVVITPRNQEQVCAFDLMKDRSKTVKLLTGT